MRGPALFVALFALSAPLGAQDPVHFLPTDRIVIRAMRDVPETTLGKGFIFRQVVGATGSFSFAELEPGAGGSPHHHTREQANVGIDGAMAIAIGEHIEPLPVGAGVITPPNVRHGIRNTSGERLISLEFHTIQRPDLTPLRPRPAVPYPVAAEPVPVPGEKELVVQLSSAAQGHGIGKTIQGETCTLAWRRLAAKGGAVDLVPSRASAELFVYVVSGEAELAAKGVTERVTAGMLILIPASQEHVTIKSSGAADVSLVEFRPALR